MAGRCDPRSKNGRNQNGRIWKMAQKRSERLVSDRFSGLAVRKPGAGNQKAESGSGNWDVKSQGRRLQIDVHVDAQVGASLNVNQQ